MAGEFEDLDLSISALKANYNLILTAIQGEARSPQIRDSLARAVFAELIDIAKDIQGSDWDYHIKTLGGSRTVLDLQAGYPELSDL